MVHRISLAASFTLAVTLMISSAAHGESSKTKGKGGAGKAVEKWQGAFGSMPNTASDEVDIPAETSKDHEAALAALGELGSFPLKVHSGGEGGTFWTDSTVRSFVPETSSRKFKVGECQFEIKTGALSARQYEAGKSGTFAVKQDALSPQTTLAATEAAPTYVSVTSELYANILDNRASACKSMLKDKSKRIGSLDLEETTLVLTTSDEKQFPAGQVRGAKAAVVYLKWNEEAQALRLEDQAGLAPSVESPIFEIKPTVVGDLFVEVAAKLSMKKLTAAAANKIKVNSDVADR